MDINNIYDRLNAIFIEVFDDDSIYIDENTTADDIEDWDSLEHITLINAVEKEFGLKFKMNEISTMQNVGAMVEIIVSRGRRL